MPSAVSYFLPVTFTGTQSKLVADVCVYAANAAGVMAAVQVARSGNTVVLLNPGSEIGGMSTGGLSFTDLGNKAAIGGLARDFYRRLGTHYGKDEEWNFEPHVALRILEEMLAESGIKVIHGQYVDSVKKRNSARGLRISEIRMTGGLVVAASYFIDCSYEGDLMARAKVSFTIGRESNSEHGERFNGQQIHSTHQFSSPIDPFVVPGDRSSGLLPGIEEGTFIPGEGDRRVQTYNFRMCLTQRATIRRPFPKPDGYDRSKYELLSRVLNSGWKGVFDKFDRIQGSKVDTNNNGPVSTDYIGASAKWPDAQYFARERIFQDHVVYQQGYHWFMCNDPRVPKAIREAYSKWGLARDEFIGNRDNWPHQLYVREARRMVGEIVVTENHCTGVRIEEDIIGLGAYQMDSHHCRRLLLNGVLLNEGDVQIKLHRPYGIPLRSVLPKKSECTNLLVPVCLSATHIALGSIRMEPVFMILAQSAAVVACQALASDSASVQDVNYSKLRARLESVGQRLSASEVREMTIDNEPHLPRDD